MGSVKIELKNPLLEIFAIIHGLEKRINSIQKEMDLIVGDYVHEVISLRLRVATLEKGAKE